MHVKITRVEKRILEEIARKGPKYPNELVDEIGKKYGPVKRISKKHEGTKDISVAPRSIQMRLNILQREKNLLKVVKEEKLPNGSTMKWYDLSLCGLVIVLQYEDTWNDIDTIIKHQADKLPLVFEKWHYFVAKGVKDQLCHALRQAVDDPIVGFYVGARKESLVSAQIAEQNLQERLTKNVLFLGMNVDLDWSPNYPIPFCLKRLDKSSEEWIEVLLGDPKLIDCVYSELDHFTEKFKNSLLDIEMLRNEIVRIASLRMQHP